MSKQLDTAALRDFDAGLPRSRRTDSDPWVNFLSTMWITAITGLLFGRGEWAGWIALPFALTFAVLTVWSVRWRWQSDMRRAYLAGQDKWADDLIEEARRAAG